jgi:hypothetical protein
MEAICSSEMFTLTRIYGITTQKTRICIFSALEILNRKRVVLLFSILLVFGFGVAGAMSMKSTDFWVVTLCSCI